MVMLKKFKEFQNSIMPWYVVVPFTSSITYVPSVVCPYYNNHGASFTL